MTPDIPTGRRPPVGLRRRAVRLLPGALLVSLLASPAPPAAAEPPVDGDSFAFAAGEHRTWTVDLAADEAFRLRALPRGVDVELRLFAPAEPGGKEARQDAPVRSQGIRDRTEQEELVVVASRPGRYRIEAHALAGQGRCRLELDGPRPATDEDRRRVEAAAATQALFDAYSAHGPESAKETAAALEQALSRADGLLLAWRELGDPGREAAVLNVRGTAAYDRAEYAQAADDLSCAARLAGAAGDEAFTADALNDLGRAERKRGWLRQAAALFLEALELYRDQGDLDLQAVALSNLGNVSKDLGDLRTGVAHLQESLRLARGAGKPVTALTTQVNLCDALQSLHDREEALATCQAALDEARRLGEQGLEGAALNNFGTLYESLGEWDKALELYRQALALARELPNEDREGRTLINLGNLSNADREGRTLINLGFLYQRSWRDAALGQDPLREAEASYRAALEIMRGLSDQKMEARALSQLALVEVQRGRGPAALQLAQQALSLATDPEEADPEEEPIARFALGEALRLTGDLPGAREQLDLARELQRRRGDLNLEAGATFALARVERALDNLPAAVAQADAALALIESLRARVVSPDLRASFLASKQDYYAFKIDTLMRLHERAPQAGHAAAALQASDRARARSLFEVLSQAQADLRRGVAPALLERERRASEDLNVGEWYRRYSLRTTAALAPEVSLRLASAQAESQKVEEELLLASPLYATLAQPRSTPLAEIQRDVLDPDTLLVEYYLADERSYAWAVTSGGVTGVALPGRAVIETAARSLYDRLTSPRPKTESPAALDRRIAEIQRTAAELFELVLAPMATLLRSKQRLVVVSDGALQYVPFEVLPLPVAPSAAGNPPVHSKRIPWLIESHEVVVLPSASVIAVIRRELAARQPPAGALAVLADPVFRPDDRRLRRPPAVPGAAAAPAALSLVIEAPDVPRAAAPSTASVPAAPAAPDRPAAAPLPSLPYSRQEAEAIAKLVHGGEVLKALDFKASRDIVLSGRLADFRRVHFATHGILDSQHPEQTSLVLSLFDQDGRTREGHLSLRDVYELDLNADLVVLSACQTALGKDVRGEGLIGLTRGFMHAGAARVVASLWSVQDRATAELMKRFYDGMLTRGQRPAEALRKAQLQLSRDQRWQDPYYWAAFSLQGEWR